jgi:ferredoxin-NADP reductase
MTLRDDLVPDAALGGVPAWNPAAPALRAVPAPTTALAQVLEEVLGPEHELDQQLVCRRRVQVTHDVVTLVLQPTDPRPVRFSPGQYLTVVLDVAGRRAERCYTISSPPTRPHLLTITVKRVPGGEVSTWLHDDLRPGDVLHALGPLGSFTVADHPAPRHLLLSAGSGITPTLSTLRTLADLAEPADVVVVHSGRSERDLPCRAELDALAAATDGLRVHWLREDVEGRLSPELLTAWVPDLREREVLTCGPSGYMASVRAMLAGLGVDAARCHEESFVIDAPSSLATPVPEAAPGPAGGGTVRFRRSGREAVCGPGTTVLDAAASAGVVLPSSCQQGLCGSCKSTLLSGQVEMHHQGGIRPREIAQDKFLPCCSVPQGDIDVDA